MRWQVLPPTPAPAGPGCLAVKSSRLAPFRTLAGRRFPKGAPLPRAEVDTRRRAAPQGSMVPLLLRVSPVSVAASFCWFRLVRSTFRAARCSAPETCPPALTRAASLLPPTPGRKLVSSRLRAPARPPRGCACCRQILCGCSGRLRVRLLRRNRERPRSEEHTSELQSLRHLVCRLLLEKKA